MGPIRRSEPLAVGPHRWRARVEVLEVFKGSQPTGAIMFERTLDSPGRVRLEPKTPYLFFVEDSSWPDTCSGTRRVGSGGFEQAAAWVGALRELAGDDHLAPASPWYLTSSCVARLRVGNRDDGYLRFAIHRADSERARLLVGVDFKGPLAPQPSAIVLELGRDSFRLRRPWEVWGNPPGDIVWGFTGWAFEARADTSAWSSLASGRDIGVSALGPDEEMLFHQRLDADRFAAAWEAAAACTPAVDLGSSFVVGH
ncbi:MAG: hypothetical protein R2991_07330 [Thermoanaerobaculia bacterium]